MRGHLDPDRNATRASNRLQRSCRLIATSCTPFWAAIIASDGSQVYVSGRAGRPIMEIPYDVGPWDMRQRDRIALAKAAIK